MCPRVHCGVMYSSSGIGAAEVPINRQVRKKAAVHLHDVILLSKKKKILPFATARLDLESVMLSGISQ